MVSLMKKAGGKQGKKNPLLLTHKKNVKTTWETHRLEGKVKNRGIRNVGHQKRKKARAQ